MVVKGGKMDLNLSLARPLRALARQVNASINHDDVPKSSTGAECCKNRWQRLSMAFCGIFIRFIIIITILLIVIIIPF